MPRDRGGRDSFENLVWSKKEINSLKANRLPHEAGLRLMRKPTGPKPLPVAATCARRATLTGGIFRSIKGQQILTADKVAIRLSIGPHDVRAVHLSRVAYSATHQAMRCAKSAWNWGRQRLTVSRGSNLSVKGRSRHQPSLVLRYCPPQ
ncbi:MAG TPA: hypothetical protein VFO36_12500, partial [Nitrospiraceae bacterium]|nr:hypothetical protein [Nitrospiraceae bacterium]